MTIRKLLDYLLNKLPIINLLNGKKTIIAAALAAMAEVIVQVAQFLPLDQQASALALAEGLRALAGYVGAVGLLGKAVKQ